MDAETADLLNLPLDHILASRRSLRRKLAARTGLHPVRIAVLGGSTTQELVDLLELVLLDGGFGPVFYQSEYDRYQEEALHDSNTLAAFRPDIIYIHTSSINLRHFPAAHATEEDLAASIASEVDRFRAICTALTTRIGCQVILNNAELPQFASLGSLDAVLPCGRTRFITEFNLHLVRECALNARVILHDLCSLSARVGLDRWSAPERFYSYKIVTTPVASYAWARSLAATVRGIFGQTRKLLVLDLDNTLWGGVIGDDGVEGLQLGRETPLAEAFTAFAQYCLRLREQGILLAVCSKNDEATARSAFEHPECVLQLSHFVAFKANWLPKHENILEIARELKLGADSFVFVDDNPAERALVAAQIPGILVPDLPDDVAGFPAAIEAAYPFHQIALSQEDLSRADQYICQQQRTASQQTFSSYGHYLDSLEMVAEVEPFTSIYLARIAQLINKTNQFNLTSRRYTLAELQGVLHDPNRLGLYARLRDRFGDNGLVSVVLGTRIGDDLELDLWLMSCRVLKRDLEFVVLDELVTRAILQGVLTLIGRYLPTRKNGMVADHYHRLGFSLINTAADGSLEFRLTLKDYRTCNRHIHVAQQVTPELEIVAR